MRLLRVLSFLFVMLATGCVTAPSEAPDSSDTLYEALGERQGIAAIVDRFLFILSDDLRIVHHFADTDIDRFRTRLIEQLCVKAGGPCQYAGDTMRQVHAGLGITEADMNALVEDLIEAMEDLKVPMSAQQRLIARLAPLRNEIIER